MQKKPPPRYSAAAVLYQLWVSDYCLQRHVLRLATAKRSRCVWLCAEEARATGGAGIVGNFAALCGGITESDTRDARAEQAIDLAAAGVELSLVDLHALSDEPIVELVAPCFRHDEAGWTFPLCSTA